MALTEERRAALLRYCRVEPDAEDVELIDEGYDAAVAYLADAGVREPSPETPRRSKYDRCINALVLDYYDLRGTQLAGASLVDNPAFRRSLNQLKLTEPDVSESDTGDEDGELL